MTKYQNILVGYLNDSKNSDGKYLSLKNVSGTDIIITAGKVIYMSMTPKSIRDKNPKIPMFTQSIKIEENETQPAPVKKQEEFEYSKVNDEIPY